MTTNNNDLPKSTGPQLNEEEDVPTETPMQEFKPVNVDDTYKSRTVKMTDRQYALWTEWYEKDNWDAFPGVLTQHFNKFLQAKIPEEHQVIFHGKFILILFYFIIYTYKLKKLV